MEGVKIHKLLNVNDIAELLQKKPETIRNDLRRRPESLPPWIVIPGSKTILWIEEDVENWLDECRVTNKKAKTVGRTIFQGENAFPRSWFCAS